MSVIKRLHRLTGEVDQKKQERVSLGEIQELRRRIDAIMSRRPEGTVAPAEVPGGNPRSLYDVVDGTEMSNEHGTFFVTQGALKKSTCHGSRRIGELTSPDMKHVALLANDPRLARLDCSKGLFLDTETTGLSGGTGTTAFLIGLGWFEGNIFMTRQLFIRDFTEERASLACLQEVAGNRQFLITFNGKAFDVGLLSTRFIMNRLDDPLRDLPHLDLLFPCRRLLGHRVENCRLVTLEAQVLGLRRRGDIPGCEIPQRYFDWLRRRDARLMEAVFEHNRLDVVSMAALMAHLSDLLDRSKRSEALEYGDRMAVARLLLDRGDAPRACRLLESLVVAECGGIAGDAGRILSLIYKREGRWSEAVSVWERMIIRDPGDLFALEELAKWCEHRHSDFERAIGLVNQALVGTDGMPAGTRDAFIYRLRRLRRRSES